MTTARVATQLRRTHSSLLLSLPALWPRSPTDTDSWLAQLLRGLVFGMAAGLVAFCLEATRLAYVRIGPGYPLIELFPVPVLAAAATRGAVAGASAAVVFMLLALPSLGHSLLREPLYPMVPLLAASVLVGLSCRWAVAWRIAAAIGGWALYVTLRSSLIYIRGDLAITRALPGDLLVALGLAFTVLALAITLSLPPAGRTAGRGSALSTAPPPPAPSLPFSTAMGLGAVVVMLAAWMRIDGLMELELFVDEASWLKWARAAAPGDWGGLFLPWTEDRRTPLYGWAIAVASPLIEDELLRGRAVSAAAGVGTCIGLALLGRSLVGWLPGLAAALLYALNPMAVYFEQLAADDALLTFFASLGLASSVWLARRPTMPRASLVGLALGAALLTKPTAVLLLACPVLSLALLCQDPWRKRLLPCTVALGLAAAMVAPLLFVAQGNATGAIGDHALSLAQAMGLPHNLWRRNVTHVAQAWQWAMGPVLPLVLVSALSAAVLRPSRRAIFLGLMAIGLTLAFVLVGRSLHTRYLLPALVAASALLGLLLVEAWALALRVPRLPRAAAYLGSAIVTVAIAMPSAVAARAAATDPVSAQLPRSVRINYIEERSSGYGTRLVAKHLREEAAIRPIAFLYRPGGFLEEAVLRGLAGAEGVVTIPTHAVGLGDEPRSVAGWTREGWSVFFMINQPRTVPRGRATKIIAAELPEAYRSLSVRRPGGKTWIDVYRIDP